MATQLTTLVVSVAMLGVFGFVYSSASASRLLLILLVAFPVLGVVTIAAFKLQRALLRRSEGKLYAAYLIRRQAEAEWCAGKQRASLEYAHPAPGDLLVVVQNGIRLWERRPVDSDFLRLRVGVGESEIAPAVQFDITDAWSRTPRDDLSQLFEERRRDLAFAGQIPILVGLGTPGVLAVVGESGRRVLDNMLAELVVFHGPDDVRVVLVGAPGPSAGSPWIGEVPHAGNEPRSSGATRSAAIARLAGLLEVRREVLVSAGADQPDVSQAVLDRLVVLVDGFSALSAPDEVRRAISEAATLNLTVICICPDGASLPEEATLVIDRSNDTDLMLARQAGNEPVAFRPDAVGTRSHSEISSALRNLSLLRPPDGRVLVESPGLREVTALQPDQRLSEIRSSTPNLTVVLGATQSGSLLSLNLLESAKGGLGPHGMLSGSSGFGKSALLQAVVAQLVAKNHPSNLNLLLVDFKGGEAFDEFVGVPHVTGLVTDLEGDATLIQRVRLAIEGELTRREGLLGAFREHLRRTATTVDHESASPTQQGSGDHDDVGGIHEYRAWASEHDAPGIPSLLIAIDEFGELLTAHPDTLATFISICRRGRSLGVHLLFSTQKVELRELAALGGHLGYRISLSMNSTSEFRDMVGTRKAPEPPHVPGAAVVATKDVATLFQATFAGRRVDGAATAGLPKRRKTELQVVLDLVRSQDSQNQRPLWLPPLSASMPLLLPQELGVGHAGHAGTVDRPTVPEQTPLKVDPARESIGLVGAAGMGVSVAMMDLAISACWAHSPDELELVIVDPVGSIEALGRLPHCVARIDAHTLTHTVPTLNSLISSTSSAGSARTMIVLIDAWGRAGAAFDDLPALLTSIVGRRGSVSCRIVVGARSWSEIPRTVRQLLQQSYEFHLNDPFESAIGYRLSQALPAGTPGRALCLNGEVAQFADVSDVRLVDADGNEIALGEDETAIGLMEARWGTPRHSWTPFPLPDSILLSQLEGVTPDDLSPIGLSEPFNEPFQVPMLSRPHRVIVAGGRLSGKSSTLDAIWTSLDRNSGDVERFVVALGRELPDRVDGPQHLTPNPLGVPSWVRTEAELATFRSALAREVARRREKLEELGALATGEFPWLAVLVDDADVVTQGLAESFDIGLNFDDLRQVGPLRLCLVLTCSLSSLTFPGALLNAVLRLPNSLIKLDYDALIGSATPGVQPGRAVVTTPRTRPFRAQVAMPEDFERDPKA